MKGFLFVVVLLLIATAAFAANDQAFLGMFAETSMTKMAGMPPMPEMPDIPGMDASAMANMPGMGAMFGGGKPTRTLTVRLWSPGIAPKDATAVITPPAGLKQGDKLVLDLYRPKASAGETGSGGESGGTESGGDMKFTIKYYWGSSATVKPGQPKVITWDSMNADAKREMSKQAEKVQKDSYFYKPDWTTGYWPTKKQPGKIAKDASLVGNYALATNYTGNVEIECPKNVDFLASIDMTSPNLEEVPDLTEALAFKWKPIPNLLGSHAMIMGMEGENTLIIWSSSEVFTESMMGVDWGFLQMADVRKFVADKIMMPGSQSNVTVPAGIFKDCDMVNLTMTGYGPGAALDKGQPLPRIQTKTDLSIMLGGKMMEENMGDMEF